MAAVVTRGHDELLEDAASVAAGVDEGQLKVAVRALLQQTTREVRVEAGLPELAGPAHVVLWSLLVFPALRVACKGAIWGLCRKVTDQKSDESWWLRHWIEALPACAIGAAARVYGAGDLTANVDHHNSQIRFVVSRELALLAPLISGDERWLGRSVKNYQVLHFFAFQTALPLLVSRSPPSELSHWLSSLARVAENGDPISRLARGEHVENPLASYVRESLEAAIHFWRQALTASPADRKQVLLPGVDTFQYDARRVDALSQLKQNPLLFATLHRDDLRR